MIHGVDSWVAYRDGFVLGRVGVFPSYFGSWEVLVRSEDGEWREAVPEISVGPETRSFDRERSPPYVFETRTRDCVIAEVKRLAAEWAATHLAN